MPSNDTGPTGHTAAEDSTTMMASGVSNREAGLWLWGAAVGVAIGIGVAFSLEIAVGATFVLISAMLLMGSDVRNEVLVALYWASLCVYSTIFSGVEISGFFYPFYLAFAFAALSDLMMTGLQVRVSTMWLMGLFLATVLLSFIGFSSPVGFEVVQRVIAFLIAPLVLLQFRSRRGLRVVLYAGLITAIIVATWVVTSAAQGGFQYRADVDVNQNVVAFYIGLGLIIAIALSLANWGGNSNRPVMVVLFVLASGFLGYAMLLLSSRGIAIAVGIAILGLILRVSVQAPRKLLALLVLTLCLGTGLLLPGGQGLLERFQGERVESGGSRIPIWNAVIESYTSGNIGQLVLGHGFDSSKALVRQETGTLTSTHNAYLQILYEFGVVGFFLFLALHAAAIGFSWSTDSGLGLAVYGLSWFLLGVNLTATETDGFLYWVVLASCLAIGLFSRRMPSLRPNEMRSNHRPRVGVNGD